ncbi:hypothetical protein FX983_02628 [Pseudomonas frederiksbergensis]|uniref:Uncharacterized protein n=1 Tax=Pseudomonas frederiksbergensis TaxID=104087 RepID=A0A6L5C591_9PSED|nr:hypothetical protein FX983_02628 [Pseudomonas frederiksbergensis]
MGGARESIGMGSQCQILDRGDAFAGKPRSYKGVAVL